MDQMDNASGCAAGGSTAAVGAIGYDPDFPRLARIALASVLGRMVADARVAELLGPGTQTYDQVIAAAAAGSGVAVETFGRAIEDLLTFEPWPPVKYDRDRDELLINGKRYAMAMFGEDGLKAPAGTTLTIMDGPDDMVTVKVVPIPTGTGCTCATPSGPDYCPEHAA